MLKKLVLLTALLVTLLLSCPAVFAEQDGNSCWCNTDQYGCWITNDDGSTMYLMFWSEYARQYIMGSHSRPNEMVVPFPGYYGAYRIPCGSPAPVIITAAPAAAPAAPKNAAPASPSEPPDETDNKNTENSDDSGKQSDPIFEACISDRSNCFTECSKGVDNAYGLNKCSEECFQKFKCDNRK